MKSPWGLFDTPGRPLERADLEKMQERNKEQYGKNICGVDRPHVVAPTGPDVRVCCNCFALVEMVPGAFERMSQTPVWQEVARRICKDLDLV